MSEVNKIGTNYTIKNGDTLTAIAAKYRKQLVGDNKDLKLFDPKGGDSVVKRFAEANGIKDPNKIEAGKTLIFPSQTKETAKPKYEPSPAQQATVGLLEEENKASMEFKQDELTGNLVGPDGTIITSQGQVISQTKESIQPETKPVAQSAAVNNPEPKLLNQDPIQANLGNQAWAIGSNLTAQEEVVSPMRPKPEPEELAPLIPIKPKNIAKKANPFNSKPEAESKIVSKKLIDSSDDPFMKGNYTGDTYTVSIEKLLASN